MSRNSWNGYTDLDSRYAAAELRTSFLKQVYLWMSVGLAVTGGVAAAVVAILPQFAEQLSRGSGLFLLLFLVEIALVIWLSRGIMSMSASLAGGLFIVYSIVNGIVFSTFFMYYTGASLASTFFATAATFGGMSIFGYTTKRDLSGIGSMAYMALWGLIVASIVNIFFASTALNWIVTYVGIAIFVVLTAYDTQKLAEMSDALKRDSADNVTVGKIAILGALKLYLDFINLFILLLRLFGNRR